MSARNDTTRVDIGIVDGQTFMITQNYFDDLIKQISGKGDNVVQVYADGRFQDWRTFGSRDVADGYARAMRKVGLRVRVGYPEEEE